MVCVGAQENGNAVPNVQERAFLSCLYTTPTGHWDCEKWHQNLMFELQPLLETTWNMLDLSFLLPEDLWRVYSSQIRRLVCYPRSPPVPRYSGPLPATVCPCGLCEHRGEENWIAGAVQFPLAGRPLQGHNWSEGKVLRGAEGLLCHSPSGEIQTARADTAHRVKQFPEGAGHEQSVIPSTCFSMVLRRVCWYRVQIQVLQTVSQSKPQLLRVEREHCIVALQVSRKVETVCSLLLLSW